MKSFDIANRVYELFPMQYVLYFLFAFAILLFISKTVFNFSKPVVKWFLILLYSILIIELILFFLGFQFAGIFTNRILIYLGIFSSLLASAYLFRANFKIASLVVIIFIITTSVLIILPLTTPGWAEMIDDNYSRVELTKRFTFEKVKNDFESGTSDASVYLIDKKYIFLERFIEMKIPHNAQPFGVDSVGNVVQKGDSVFFKIELFGENKSRQVRFDSKNVTAVKNVLMQ